GRQLPRRALLPPRLEERQDLHRLAEPHVVRETAAEPEVAQEVEPAEAELLVRTQSSPKSGRRGGGGDPAEALQALPRLGEGLVPARLGRLGEPGVQQERLRPL